MKGNGQNIHELTRIEAFLLSEKAGHPSHMHDYFWAQAEGIVRQRRAGVDLVLEADGGKGLKPGKSAPPKAKPAAPKLETVALTKKKAAVAPAKAEKKKTSKPK